MQVLDWLLEEDAPGVELLARIRLLGESPSSRRIRSLRRRCNEYTPVAKMIARLEDSVVERAYKKYEGAFWTLMFLAEMQADGDAAPIRALAERVLSLQQDNGGYLPYGKRNLEIVCLTANVLRALVYFGYGGSTEVAKGYHRLAERILPNRGVPCAIIDGYSLLTDCKMTLPQTLRSVAAAPASLQGGETEKLRQLLIEKILEIQVYRYVRPDSAAFGKDLVPLRPQGVSQRAFTMEYKENHPIETSKLLPKNGWLQFGFPHSYNSDLLEAMLALAEAGADHDPVMDEALDQIESKRGSDGSWKMQSSLNGKMLAGVERRGAPSKWLTLQAMTVLLHFGRIEV